MSHEMSYGIHADPIISQIHKLKNKSGMEIFFNIDGLDEMTAEVVEMIASKPGGTFLFFTVGASGVGKEGATQGLIEAIKNNEVSGRALRKAKSELEIYHVCISDGMKEAIERGLISRDKRWGTGFGAEDFANGSRCIREAIAWAIHSRPDGRSVTRVVAAEICGVLAEDPLNPEKRIVDNVQQRGLKPINIMDIGSSVVQTFASFEELRVLALPTLPGVYESSTNLRTFVQNAYEFLEEQKNPEQVKRIKSVLIMQLRKFGMEIDDPDNVTIGDILKSSGTKGNMENVNAGENTIMDKRWPVLLRRNPELSGSWYLAGIMWPTARILSKHGELRVETEETFLDHLLDTCWGVSPHKRLISRNPKYGSEYSENKKGNKGNRKKTILHYKAGLKQYKFPPPEKRGVVFERR